MNHIKWTHLTDRGHTYRIVKGTVGDLSISVNVDRGKQISTRYWKEDAERTIVSIFKKAGYLSP